MKSKSLIGKFIKEEWVNGEYKQTWLRRVNRETNTQYISDVQRYVKSWEGKESEKKIFVGKWAKRYAKLKNGQVGYKTTHRSNPDGKMTLSIVTDLSTQLCSCSYSELFETDVREIQDAKEYPRKGLEARQERASKRDNYDKLVCEKDYVLAEYIVLQKGTDTHPIGGWDAPITKYLEETFKVPVYNLYENIREHWKLSKLSKSGTLMHITHFGNDKEVITFDENYHNRTIMFWLFKDKLVFQYEDGKDGH